MRLRCLRRRGVAFSRSGGRARSRIEAMSSDRCVCGSRHEHGWSAEHRERRSRRVGRRVAVGGTIARRPRAGSRARAGALAARFCEGFLVATGTGVGGGVLRRAVEFAPCFYIRMPHHESNKHSRSRGQQYTYNHAALYLARVSFLVWCRLSSRRCERSCALRSAPRAVFEPFILDFAGAARSRQRAAAMPAAHLCASRQPRRSARPARRARHRLEDGRTGGPPRAAGGAV